MDEENNRMASQRRSTQKQGTTDLKRITGSKMPKTEQIVGMLREAYVQQWTRPAAKG